MAFDAVANALASPSVMRSRDAAAAPVSAPWISGIRVVPGGSGPARTALFQPADKDGQRGETELESGGDEFWAGTLRPSGVGYVISRRAVNTSYESNMNFVRLKVSCGKFRKAASLNTHLDGTGGGLQDAGVRVAAEQKVRLDRDAVRKTSLRRFPYGRSIRQGFSVTLLRLWGG